MKRILACLGVLLLLLGSLAEEALFLTCDCGKTPCVCFLQEGDTGPAVGGVIALLKEKNYLAEKHAKYVFDEAVTQAVQAFQRENGLTVSGIMDDLTLTLLIWGDVEWDEAARHEVVWVPVNGGRKYHAKPTCSDMKQPRKMSRMNVRGLQIEPCKRCYPGLDE